MATEITVITQLSYHLLRLHQQQATGELVITPAHASAGQWHLYFYLGRLVYATGGHHRVRRWYRILKQHCPALLTNKTLMNLEATEEPWEMHHLNYALRQGWITATQVKSMISSSVKEVVFAFVDQEAPKTEWRPGKFISQPSIFLSIEQVLQEARDLRDQWQKGGLKHLQDLLTLFSPDMAPQLKHPERLKSQVSETAYQSLTKLMNGKQTLWDVSVHMQKPLPVLIRSLLPLLHQGVIELKTVPDFPAPVLRNRQLTSPSSLTRKGLIACIDDSPVIGEVLDSMLAPLGYEVFTILNPLQGIATLLERKPDLIFLDLVMPNTNGYELCSFLRKTSTFQNTPIVILTGHDGVIDRVRAKLVGASEFLGKPPELAKVLQVLDKQLGKATASPVTDEAVLNPHLATT
ncbi:hypothetical protein BST81_22195 [Leptolyngbya sp. 'hensonii']|uniref:response regulator n=1 Tax=Leptolyngbya sp. 'hensonii' TaxID=1922337 RepID=UPI00094F89F0|nr:response regulator [Leptolyngbya sp. 'hensonii']OLP16309.1 hypothetical protein BST81_22195 [Leptolyngbya sp. 'hensonii']